MISLPAPYGVMDSYTYICIALDAKFPSLLNRDAVTEELLGYSCYPPAIARILSCLSNSGRYECAVQATWVLQNYHEACRLFDLAGVTLTVKSYWVDGEQRPFKPRGWR